MLSLLSWAVRSAAAAATDIYVGYKNNTRIQDLLAYVLFSVTHYEALDALPNWA